MNKKQNVDVSIAYSDSTIEKIRIIKRVLQTQGVGGVISKIFKRLYFKIKRIEFKAEMIGELEIIGENKKHGVTFVGTSSHVLDDIIKKLEKLDHTLRDGIFIDFGSGKGNMIIEAEKLGFKKSIGIEFVKKFYQISLENIKKLFGSKHNILVINDDASNFKLLIDTKLIFFYNPFDGEVMKKVIENICNIKYTNRVFIIYHNPVQRDLFLNNNRIKLLEQDIAKTGEISDIYEVL